MASKQVRKITSITANELVKVDMADRDGDGKKIKETYATKEALTTAQNSADSGINANSAAIAALGTRMTTVEGNASANASAISTEASTRATAVSNEATVRANADTALSGRIDTLTTNLANEVTARQNDINRVTAIAEGQTKTFAFSTTIGSYDNGFFNNENTIVSFEVTMANPMPLILRGVKCSLGILPNGIGTAPYLVLIPSEMTNSEKEAAKSNAFDRLANDGVSSEDIYLAEIDIGDIILLNDIGLADRWYQGFNGASSSPKRTYTFFQLEARKIDLTGIEGDIDDLESDVSSLQTTVGGHTTTITNLQTTVAGKQDALTFDSAPTANSNNSLTSGAVKTALDNLQSSLNLQSSVIGSVTIND